jgi:hypothetical protein
LSRSKWSEFAMTIPSSGGSWSGIVKSATSGVTPTFGDAARSACN